MEQAAPVVTTARASATKRKSLRRASAVELVLNEGEDGMARFGWRSFIPYSVLIALFCLFIGAPAIALAQSSAAPAH